MLEKLNNAWDNLGELTTPPDESILLHQDDVVTVYVSDEWGPPVPYGSVPREGGGMNHGYVRLKGDPKRIGMVPEVQGWPEYQRFLERANTETSPIETVGCEKSFFPCDCGDAKAHLGSYTDFMFTEIPLNDEPRHFLALAAAFAQAMEGGREWWASAELGIQRSKAIHGCSCPWMLMLRIGGYGRDEAMARQSWAASIDRIGSIIEQLPPSFRSSYSPPPSANP